MTIHRPGRTLEGNFPDNLEGWNEYQIISPYITVNRDLDNKHYQGRPHRQIELRKADYYSHSYSTYIGLIQYFSLTNTVKIILSI